MLRYDLQQILDCGCNQVTFYPLMVSPAVEGTLTKALGTVDYSREQQMYELICNTLTQGLEPAFRFGSAWTFSRTENALIDEYVVDYEEYAAVGSGGMSFLDGNYLVNTFSLDRYGERIRSGRTGAAGYVKFSMRDKMRYRFLMQLFGLRLDKRKWMEDFGCTVSAGLPAEYFFMKAAGAFWHEDEEEITLSPKGRYLLVAMMRQFFVGVNSVRDEARREAGIDLAQMISG
jgi:coproporphyrinogen III oxidase-like Fe-S oxidoreductase